MNSLIRNVVGTGLLAHGAHQFLTNPNWWLYTPICVLAALVSLRPTPSSKFWRVFSSVSAVGGGLLTLFLLWTFLSIDDTPTLKLDEGKQLLQVSVASLLVTSTRLSTDQIKSPVHYVRTSLLLLTFAVALLSAVVSFKYFAE
ncbi:unnamed protein product [Caenorhabditis auriculariae]|uniref:Uncharacterized protein n=1 Tax=Caenorhabditis auriculariae TaxID=2777116 RepID=A0A8S1GUR2_9PELO|nr:unnamed protein product [Caenorhabditis auriculariae]